MFSTNDMQMVLDNMFNPIEESSSLHSTPLSVSAMEPLSGSAAPLKLTETKFEEKNSLQKDIFNKGSWGDAFENPLCLTALNSVNSYVSHMDQEDRSSPRSTIFSELDNSSRSPSPILSGTPILPSPSPILKGTPILSNIGDSFNTDDNMITDLRSAMEEVALDPRSSWGMPVKRACISPTRKSETMKSEGMDELTKVLEQSAGFRREAMKMKVLREQQQEEIESLGRSLKSLENDRQSAIDAMAEVTEELRALKEKNRKTVTELWQKIQEIDDENVQLVKMQAELEKAASTPSIDIELSTTTTLWNAKMEQDKLNKEKADQKMAEKKKAKAGKQKEKLSAWMDSRSRSSGKTQAPKPKPSSRFGRFARAGKRI